MFRKKKEKRVDKIFLSIKKIKLFYENNWGKCFSHSPNTVIFSFMQQTNQSSYAPSQKRHFTLNVIT